jgi:peptidyl-prolyl cis-trans isomerase C
MIAFMQVSWLDSTVRCALALGVLTACGPKGPDRKPTASESEILARIDDQVITIHDLQARIEELDPFSRSRYSSAEQKKRLLENVVRLEVLAKEARARGYDQDPDVHRVLKKELVDRLIKRDIDDGLSHQPVADAEIEGYYRTHLEQFQRPEQVRVSQIFTVSETKAQTLAGEARRAGTEKEFREIVTRASEDEDSKIRGGDLTFFDRESMIYPGVIVEAAFALHDVGEVSKPVKSDKGFHVLRLTQRRPAATRPLEEVRNDIRRMILGDLRAKKIEVLVAEMRKKTKVEIYEDQLAKVTVGAAPPQEKR